MIDQESGTAKAATLRALAISILGSNDGEMLWQTPHPMLKGETPAEAAAGPAGQAEVERILRSLEHGLPV